MFTVDVSGFAAETEKLWGGAMSIIRQRVGRAVGIAVAAGAAAIKSEHTYKNRTGELSRSIVGFVEGWRGDTFVGYIRAGALHASLVEYPTRAHEIHGNPFLSFVWKGVKVSFRYVRHPGTKGQPFMHLGYYKAERVLEAEIEKAMVVAQEFLNR
jgi:hypothetical protein